ncbi:MAG: PEP-CTERM sorting domain-containing protein [Proteobacteria bacterium]|nr:PEP-CTERM sorting domain-containing protein [Pseudomonadota bacterium]MBU1713761.1 PEP-CTERM sorting domain-containing protein [Pseudomonadota bacterium]
MTNINKKNIPVGTIAVIFAVILILSAPSANATRLVYPDDPYWGEHIMSNGEVSITPNNPRNGNGSLELTTTGDLGDWAFYTRYADDVKRNTWGPSDITTSWGLLSEISDLSFDWYREDIEINNQNLLSYDPFHVQTPVLRLLIRDGDIHSELIWERFYTDSNRSNMILGDWVEEDLIAQNFWRHTFFPVSYTNNSGTEVPSTYLQTLLGITPLSWADVALNYYSDDAVVYGLSVGVGSYWPANYLGYADTVYLAFNNGSPVIDDNFEFPVPEPSTLLLLLSGIATLTAGRRLYGKPCQA